MTSAQPDQVLVQPEDVTTIIIETRWWSSEFGTYRVIAAEPVLLDSTVAGLVARVNARCAAGGEQDHQRVFNVAAVVQPAGDPSDVVVADERHRHEVVE